MKRIVISLFVLLLLTQSLLSAQRKGFILGFSMGPSLSFIHAGKDDGSKYDKTHFGIGFDFKIGYAFTNQFSFQYNHKGAIFFSDAITKERSEEQKIIATLLFPFFPLTFSHNNAGFGMTYYFKPTHPSFFIDGQFGFSIYPIGDWFNDLSGGTALSFGAGYEFAEHWSVSGSALFGFGSRESGSGVQENTRAFTALFAVGYLFY